MSQLLLGTAVFVVAYATIATERLHRTVAALAGGLLIILLNIIPQERAFEAVDWNVIFLLAGMMMMVNVLRQTGVFQWLAAASLQLARGEPFRLLLILSVVTAITSAFLDNVTTVVLIAPLTLFIAASLSVDPVPFLISEILASNIGGTATLIGDPPNILIGSAAGLDFVAFMGAMGPISILILGAYLVVSWFLFGRQMRVPAAVKQKFMSTPAEVAINDFALLRKTLIVLGLTILGFLLHGVLGYEPGTVALAGAVTLLVVARLDPHEVLRDVEWTTLFFFIGLFILVEGVVEVGLIERLGRWALDLTGGNLTFTALLLMWLSALLSGVVDNIPYTATMIPLVKELGEHMPVLPLWWALALGACLGGNLTIIGASANVIVANVAERSGHRISFGRFLRYGALVTFLSMVLSSAYLYLRYLMY